MYVDANLKLCTTFRSLASTLTRIKNASQRADPCEDNTTNRTRILLSSARTTNRKPELQ